MLAPITSAQKPYVYIAVPPRVLTFTERAFLFAWRTYPRVLTLIGTLSAVRIPRAQPLAPQKYIPHMASGWPMHIRTGDLPTSYDRPLLEPPVPRFQSSNAASSMGSPAAAAAHAIASAPAHAALVPA